MTENVSSGDVSDMLLLFFQEDDSAFRQVRRLLITQHVSCVADAENIAERASGCTCLHCGMATERVQTVCRLQQVRDIQVVLR
jgi:hypothetical protein